MISRRSIAGWTIVELLVASVILSLLLALAVVGLSQSRRMAVRLKCESHIRSCDQSMTAYSGDFQGAFTQLCDPPGTMSFGNGGFTLDYELQSIHWPLALRGYLGEGPLAAVQWCPGSATAREVFGGGGFENWIAQYPAGYVQTSDFELCFGAISDPSYWKPDLPPQPIPVDAARTVRRDEVSFPSAKGIVIERTAFHLRGDGAGDPAVTLRSAASLSAAFPVAFGDGHVRSLRKVQLRPAVPGGPAGGSPVLSTLEGVRGQDSGGP